MGQESIEGQITISNLFQSYLRTGRLNPDQRNHVVGHFHHGVQDLTQTGDFLGANQKLRVHFPEIPLNLFVQIISQIPFDTQNQTEREVLALTALTLPNEVRTNSNIIEYPYIHPLQFAASVQNHTRFNCPGDWIKYAA